MSRFNGQRTTTKTTNLAGGTAYSQDPKTELASILLTSFMQNQYYRTSNDTEKRVVELMKQVPPMFAAQAALYARNEFGMRSISHVTAGHIAMNVHGEEWTKRFFDKIVFRPDDMQEILAYIFSNGGKESNALRKGFATALGRMNEYKLAKYQGKNKDVSMVDVVNIVHPKHTEAIAKLVNGTLSPADTWETKLSSAGQKAKADKSANLTKLKADAWSEMLREEKLGQLALLRNLRNIVEQAPDVVALAATQLTNRRRIATSKIFPFQYFNAYMELESVNSEHARTLLKALSQALDSSVHNLPVFQGRTLVAVDHSGSMDSRMSDKGRTTNFQVGALFGIAAAKAMNADLLYFGDSAKYYNVTEDSVMSQVRYLDKVNLGYGGGVGYVGHGTNFSSIFTTANKRYDRVFIFSDMQSWLGTTATALSSYATKHKITPMLYCFDLTGYGTTQFPNDRVMQMAGFSEKVFDIVHLLETDRKALVKTIEAIVI